MRAKIIVSQVLLLSVSSVENLICVKLLNGYTCQKMSQQPGLLENGLDLGSVVNHPLSSTHLFTRGHKRLCATSGSAPQVATHLRQTWTCHFTSLFYYFLIESLAAIYCSLCQILHCNTPPPPPPPLSTPTRVLHVREFSL